MSSFELNKFAAAILLAGIIAMLAGILADEMVKPKQLAQPAYVVAGVERAPAAGAAPAAAEELPPITPLLAAANVAEGQAVAKRCEACHTFVKGGPNRVGPNLWDVVGNPHAHAPGFAYSPSIAGMKDKPWTFEELNKFIANPKAYAPGTKMAFAGIRKAEERASLLAYLRSLSDSPKPLQ